MKETSSKDAAEENNIVNNAPSDSQKEPLLFFNYHEFLTDKYSVHPSCEHRDKTKSIVVNHFPNNHVSIGSTSYISTRVVRIPRIFDTVYLSDIIPQFSTYVPGTEPAAIKEEYSRPFHAVGFYDDNYFGETSITPLVPDYLTELEFHTIVTKVNEYLHLAFDPYNIWNLLDSLLDLFSANLYNQLCTRFIITTYSKRKLQQLEQYISNEVNLEMLRNRPNIKVLSPRRSGYLSVCISFVCNITDPLTI